MSEFIAFKATIELLKERDMQHIIDETYQKSVEQSRKKKEDIVNYVRTFMHLLPKKRSQTKLHKC